ncbi:MAG: hypothetical protein RLZZ490_738 [Cyanobacteriota bacterium]
MNDVFLSGPELVKVLHPHLSLNTLTSWVGNGTVSTNDKGARSLRDTAIALCAKFGRENERLKTERASNDDLKEELERAKLRKLLLEGDLIEIEKEGKLGDLIRADEAIAELDDAFAKVKAKLMTIPNRMALEIAGLDDPKEIQDRLEEVCREALDELNHSLMGTDETEEPD